MGKCLMLGNGINRCIKSSIAWEDLLVNISEKYNVELNSKLSFPMQFETLVNQILYNSDKTNDEVYEEVKKKIISIIKDIPLTEEAPHKALVDKADTIITTNYDFLIEQSIDNNFSYIEKNGEIKVDKTENVDTSNNGNNKYNLENFITVSGKKVFHVHGDMRSPQSICLGYEHYAGMLQHLRNELATKKKGENLPIIIRVLDKRQESTKIWAEKFFSDDVHIIGFGLYTSEIDIWWLLTYRARLLCSNNPEYQGLIKNRIVFHDVSEKINQEMKFTLENLKVEYKFYEVHDKKYRQEYLKIAKLI